jgi:hypothetical protein
MDKSRQEKIRLLSRQNSGRAAIPSFLAELSEALGESTEAAALQSLPETDLLLQASREGYQVAIQHGAVSYRRFFRATERASVLQVADCLAAQLPTENVFFLSKLSSICGAVRVNASVLLAHTASIIRLDGDSLSAISSDATQGILIDHNPDDPPQAYEVVVWGDRWSPLGFACDQTGK